MYVSINKNLFKFLKYYTHFHKVKPKEETDKYKLIHVLILALS